MKATITFGNKQPTVSFDYAVQNPGVYERLSRYTNYYKYLIVVNDDTRFVQYSDGKLVTLAPMDKSGQGDSFIPHPGASLNITF